MQPTSNFDFSVIEAVIVSRGIDRSHLKTRQSRLFYTVTKRDGSSCVVRGRVHLAMQSGEDQVFEFENVVVDFGLPQSS